MFEIICIDIKLSDDWSSFKTDVQIYPIILALIS